MSESEEHLKDQRPSSKDAKKEQQPPNGAQAGPPEPPSYPTPLVFGINMFALYLSIFCVALDNTIISTAIPQITDQFDALDDVGWYISGE